MTLETSPSSLAAGRFDLHAGALRLALRADLGGSIAGLWHRDTPVLRSVEPSQLADVEEAACFPLLPYANRLGHAHFRFRGKEQTTVAEPGQPHSLHGVGWRRPWTIESHTAQDAVLRLVHAPDADWPYAFEALQHINLTPNALGVQLVFTNTGDTVQPVGLGWWPSFPKRSRSRLHVELAQRWENDDVTHLPIRKHAQPGIDGDVTHLDFDHAFEGWSGPARIRDERFSLQLRSGSSYLVVRSHPDTDHFSIAPCTHLPNAIHMADPAAHGLRSLAAGESCEMSLSLDIAVL